MRDNDLIEVYDTRIKLLFSPNTNPSSRLHNLNLVLLLHRKLASCRNQTPSYCGKHGSGNGVETRLPLFQLLFLILVRLDEVLEHLLQALCVGLEVGDHVLDSPLNQHAVDEAEALPLAVERGKGIEDEPIDFQVSFMIGSSLMGPPRGGRPFPLNMSSSRSPDRSAARPG